MNGRRDPDFDELIGGDLEPAERDRLRRVHELLVAAGPPPELPPELEASTDVERTVVPLHRPSRRRLVLAAVLAAAVAAAAFGAGFFLGDRAEPAAAPQYVVQMTGDQGRASLAVFPADDAGNWPMEMTVHGLDDGRYQLWLTKGGELAALCGSFLAGDDRVVVALSAPYKLKSYDAWVVTRAGREQPVLTQAPE